MSFFLAVKFSELLPSWPSYVETLTITTATLLVFLLLYLHPLQNPTVGQVTFIVSLEVRSQIPCLFPSQKDSDSQLSALANSLLVTPVASQHLLCRRF